VRFWIPSPLLLHSVLTTARGTVFVCAQVNFFFPFFFSPLWRIPGSRRSFYGVDETILLPPQNPCFFKNCNLFFLPFVPEFRCAPPPGFLAIAHDIRTAPPSSFNSISPPSFHPLLPMSRIEQRPPFDTASMLIFFSFFLFSPS